MPHPQITPISMDLSSPGPMIIAMPKRIRRRVVVSGVRSLMRYPAFVRATASSMKIIGFYRDLPDEKAEVVCEGAPKEIEKFLQAINRKDELGWPLNLYVASIEESLPPHDRQFERFTIEQNSEITAKEREQIQMEHEERMDVASLRLIQDIIVPEKGKTNSIRSIKS